jgi:hypothetical protein
MEKIVCDYYHLKIRRIRSDFAFVSSHLTVDAQSTMSLTLYHQHFNRTDGPQPHLHRRSAASCTKPSLLRLTSHALSIKKRKHDDPKQAWLSNGRLFDASPMHEHCSRVRLSRQRNTVNLGNAELGKTCVFPSICNADRADAHLSRQQKR